jgi:hypothetical protein
MGLDGLVSSVLIFSFEKGKPNQMTKDDNNIWFESWSEFVEYGSSTKTGRDATKLGSTYFYGEFDMPQAKKAAIEGWQEGTEKITKFVDLFVDKMGSLLQRDEYFYDVTGQDFDLSRVLAGEPECWLATEQVEVKAPSSQVLKIVVQAQGLAEVSAKAMMWKGAAVVALAALLERSRRRVEIELRFCNDGLSRKRHTMYIPLKQASADIDLAKLAYALAHPSCFRRLGFGVMEQLGFAGYGSSRNITPTSEADIWVPKAEPYEDAGSCEAWIIEELKKQGIELKGEGN